MEPRGFRILNFIYTGNHSRNMASGPRLNTQRADFGAHIATNRQLEKAMCDRYDQSIQSDTV